MRAPIIDARMGDVVMRVTPVTMPDGPDAYHLTLEDCDGELFVSRAHLTLADAARDAGETMRAEYAFAEV